MQSESDLPATDQVAVLYCTSRELKEPASKLLGRGRQAEMNENVHGHPYYQGCDTGHSLLRNRSACLFLSTPTHTCFPSAVSCWLYSALFSNAARLQTDVNGGSLT